jgi:iron complex transport system ATP-binding protein
MERLGIARLAKRVYTQLSGGEQQLVIIARALAQEPVFLLMDEPASGLDFGNRLQLIEQVKRLADDGLGIVMATHFPEHALDCRAHVVMIHQETVWRQAPCDRLICPDTLATLYNVPPSSIPPFC